MRHEELIGILGHLDIPRVEIPVHERRLEANLMSDTGASSSHVLRRVMKKFRTNEETGASARSRRERRIAIAITQAVAVVVTLVLVFSLVGSPITAQKVMAQTSKWYSALKKGGRWEHVDVLVNNTHMAEGFKKFDYEMWVDQKSGDEKALVKDPETGRVIETLIAKVIPGQDPTTPDYAMLYTVYTDKPAGQKSILETDISREGVSAVLPCSGPVEPWCPIGPLEVDQFRVLLADPNEVGKMLKPQGPDARGRSQPPVMAVKGEKYLRELGKKAIVLIEGMEGVVELSTLWQEHDTVPNGLNGVTPPDVNGAPGSDAKGIYQALYFDPENMEYLGAATSELILSHMDLQNPHDVMKRLPEAVAHAKTSWTDTKLYRTIEYSDEAPDMNTQGMRSTGVSSVCNLMID